MYKILSLPEPSLTDYVPIYVTDVHSPSSFSVQLIGKETTRALESLQREITSFYTSLKGQQYTIEEVYPGQVMASNVLHAEKFLSTNWNVLSNRQMKMACTLH